MVCLLQKRGHGNGNGNGIAIAWTNAIFILYFTFEKWGKVIEFSWQRPFTNQLNKIEFSKLWCDPPITLQTDVVANIDLVDIDGVIGVGKSVEYGEGPFKKYVAFWTKFDPLPPLCHKLSHMAEPPIKNMYRLQYSHPQQCAWSYWL